MLVVHADQIDISHDQVVSLVADQLPALVGLEVVEVGGAGTVHSIYRIGEDVAARFPLRPADADHLRALQLSEMVAATEFRRVCPVPAPEPLHHGDPGHGYPLPWTAQSWVPGTVATPTSCADSTTFTQGLAVLLERLRSSDTRARTFSGGGRGGVLVGHDSWVNECIRRSEGMFDTDAMRTMWASLRELPREDPDVMSHGDLIPSNVVVDDGMLVGVLDTGGFQAADPALDLVSAWHLLSDTSRQQLRTTLGCSDLQWERGKAWAFQQGAGAYWYYLNSNPAMAEMGRTTLQRLVADT